MFGTKQLKRELDQLRTKVGLQEQRIHELERELVTWPVQMEELAEKARHALRRLSKRIDDAARAESHEQEPELDDISARVHARRRMKRALPSESQG